MKIIQSFVILLLAVSLCVFLLPIGFILETITSASCGNINKYRYKCARSLDQTGNALCGLLFTLLFVKNGGVEHGDEDVTISHVLHVNRLNGKLTHMGLLLWKLLETLDPGHGGRAVEYEEL